MCTETMLINIALGVELCTKVQMSWPRFRNRAERNSDVTKAARQERTGTWKSQVGKLRLTMSWRIQDDVA